MSRVTSNRMFSRAELVLALGFVVGCMMLGGLLGRESVRVSERARFEDFAASALRTVDTTVIEMRSAIKSMLGVHYASDEVAGMDIEAFAAQLREYSPFVERLGLFASVDGGLRGDYEAFMRERVPGFHMTDWGDDGTPVASAEREHHLTVDLMDPMSATDSAFLGTDLAALTALREPLARAIRLGEALVVPVPANWPVEGTALLLQPIYATAVPPDSDAERLDTFVGGIWLLVELTEPFGDAMASLPSAWLTLDLAGTTGTQERLALRRPNAGSRIDLALGRVSAERRWSIGGSELSLRIGQALDASARQVAAVVSAALLAGLLALAITGFVHQRRVMHRERLQSRRALEAEREKASRTLASISDAVIAVDAGGDLLYANPSALRRFGLRGSCLGEPIDRVLRFESASQQEASVGFDALVERLAVVEGDEETLSVDVLAPLSRSGTRTQALTFSRMAHGGDAMDYLFVLQDVSTERELTRELEHRAHHDAMTGCYNRFYFERRLRELIEDMAVSERRHALCYIDLDQFKIVNDTCGHAAGDRLLCELTEGLRSRLRNSDVLARLGGDEFGVIICDAPPEAARRVGEKLLDHFQNAMFEHEGNVFPVRGSIGLVEIGERNRDMTQIMKAADIACYTAKDGGRNALVVYSEEDAVMNQREEELNWLPILERALAEDRFRLLYQPIARVDAAHDARPDHYELLLRLVGDDGELITPHRFIQAAERYDLMRAIDRWVIARGLAEIAAATAAGDTTTTFSLNLSGQSAADPQLLGVIDAAFASLTLDPARLWFEITETAAITHFSTAVSLIEGVHALGARVALDDFGSGLSSFAYLRDLPVDVLKIDGQFIRDLSSSPVARAMVRAMVHVARSMNLETVAEFVEDADAMVELKALGIDYAQGWHVGRPGPLVAPTVPAALQAA